MSFAAQQALAAEEEQTFAILITRIRALEEELLALFSRGQISGTTHTSIGQEVCAAGLFAHVDPSRDAVFSTHRCHGHFLAYGGPLRGLLAEVMGKEGGICRGRGGSQHLCYGNFFSNGIVGGGVPIAAGFAEHLRAQGQGGMTVAIIGDGALGEGSVYEALNIASLRHLPLLLVVEYNGYAQSTETRTTIAGDIFQRIHSFGVETDRCPADDPIALSRHYAKVTQYVRSGRPFVQIVDTFRLMAHSKGDDNRPAELLERARKSDYLNRKLEAGDPLFVSAWESARREIQQLSREVAAAQDEPLTQFCALPKRITPLIARSDDLVFKEEESSRLINELLNRGLHQAMLADASLMVIGEDLADPYGGAFKVTKGLSTAYPDRVFSTPISEAGITGFANGVALSGGRVVVEIMFGDFVTLAMDQLINHASKFFFMYGAQLSLNLTVRLVSGGYRGYGATHSQSMEGYLCKTPGLKVIALSVRHRPDALLAAVILRGNCPTIFVENKMLYSKRPRSGSPRGFEFVAKAAANPHDLPPLHYTTSPGQEKVTVVTYGGLTDMVEQAMEQLILEEELDFEYFILTQLHPLNVEPLCASVANTGRLVTVEEGPLSFGIGAEIVAAVSEKLGIAGMRAARVAARDLPIPSSTLQERSVLPSVNDVKAAIMGLLDRDAQ